MDKSTFVITPGGFVTGRFPERWRGGLGWESRKGDLDALVRHAEPIVAKVLSRVLARAERRADVLTVGVDLNGDEGHAELIAVVDTAARRVIHRTGKSYPTGSQEHSLFHVANLRSHLLELGGERVLILGCHDLNMFSARARANQDPYGARRKRCDAMMKLARRFKPTVVLQHPHSTDTPNIWRMPWACLTRELPSVSVWASGIGYYRWRGRPRRQLRDVLEGTRAVQGVTDVVVRSR